MTELVYMWEVRQTCHGLGITSTKAINKYDFRMHFGLCVSFVCSYVSYSPHTYSRDCGFQVTTVAEQMVWTTGGFMMEFCAHEMPVASVAQRPDDNSVFLSSLDDSVRVQSAYGAQRLL